MTDTRRQPILSRLNEFVLEQLAETGNGFYQEASFRSSDTEEILEAAAVLKPSKDEVDESTRVWNERYHIPLLVLMVILLLWWRTVARPPGRKGIA